MAKEMKKRGAKKVEAPAEDTKMISHLLSEEMEKSYIDYSMSVIVGRALPDVRDGLKPVHRRILYGMSQLGTTPDKPHRKSARIVGEVMGKYHPHGDSSIYDAMVRMAQDFSMRYPLVDGHGNFGSVDGDGAAASRYTEARMSPFALEMLRDISKNTVDFIPNFDGEELEPVVLPSRFPNLLVSGSNGIAVGMATNIPPHNLGDTIDACVQLIDAPDTDNEDLIRTIKGPDFPTGALILGKSGIKDMYRTGNGKIKMRAKCSIEDGSRGKKNIIVTEIPYGVNKARMIEKMAGLVKAKTLSEVVDIRDESSREGLRIVIEVRKEANAEIVLNKLYNHTELQTNFNATMLALVNGKPKVLTLKDILTEYLEFQADVVTRRTKWDLEKAIARAHILEGLLIALDNIDEVIRIIRNSYNDAKPNLMARFGLSEVQAQAILDMRLARLQGLEREKLEKEYKELQKLIKRYQKILASRKELMKVIKKELEEIKAKESDERRTEIIPDPGEITDEDLIQDIDYTIELTKRGFVRKLAAGKSGADDENDFIRYHFDANSRDSLIILTDMGRVYKKPVYELDDTRTGARGVTLSEVLGTTSTEKLISAICVRDDNDPRSILIVTSAGLMKRLNLTELTSLQRNGSIYIKMADDVRVIYAEIDDESEMVLLSDNGKALRISTEDVRAMGRNAAGVKGMKLDEGESIVDCALMQWGGIAVLATENGWIKQFAAADITKQNRASKGCFIWVKGKLDETGRPSAIVICKNEEELVHIQESEEHIVTMKLGEIPSATRAAVGVDMADLKSVVSLNREATLTEPPEAGDLPETEEEPSGEEATEVVSVEEAATAQAEPEVAEASEEAMTEAASESPKVASNQELVEFLDLIDDSIETEESEVDEEDGELPGQISMFD